MTDVVLPEANWDDDRVVGDPWSIVVDALIYQHAGVEVPEQLAEAVGHAAMVLTSLALVRSGEYTIADMDDLWDRDPLEWRFSYAEADESLGVEAVFGDGNEPASVKTTVRGLGGKLNEHIASFNTKSADGDWTDPLDTAMEELTRRNIAASEALWPDTTPDDGLVLCPGSGQPTQESAVLGARCSRCGATFGSILIGQPAVAPRHQEG